jgi:hypothetical protein
VPDDGCFIDEPKHADLLISIYDTKIVTIGDSLLTFFVFISQRDIVHKTLFPLPRADRYGVYHPPASSTEVKERVEPYLYSPTWPS